MRVSLPTRQPTFLEQFLGRRRTRALRRRLGLVAIGVGYRLLKPRSRLVPAAAVASVGLLVALVIVR